VSLGVRIVLALCFVAAIVSASIYLFGGREPEAARSDAAAEVRQSWQSAEQCRSCHQDVWDEWYGSHHQISYLNPEVRAISDDFRNKECQACHLPQRISVTGFGQRTLPRKTRPDEGVGCIECHIDESGRVMGARDLPDAPCAPVAHPALTSIDHCASCHNQHGTTDQWRASPSAAEGVHCNDCHMPKVERRLADGRVRSGRRHVYEGAHDLDMLRRAGEFTAVLDGAELVLALENKGAGHNFPTEERHRAVDIEYRFVVPGEAEGAWERAYRFRMPYRDEPGEDTQLPAGQRREVRVPVPAGAVAAEARLWYRLKPYVGDEDPASTLLFERKVEIP
jgi:nitrate/TMAO reductase-like tetraheme cytochrome c subunit